MGNPMSQQLIKAGYDIRVFNRSKEKEEALKPRGDASLPSPAELLQQSDVVIIMVSDDQAIREIFTGHQGLFSAKVEGRILINTSTVSPGISKEMASLCEDRSNHYIDAPVSGSVKKAEEGQFVIMVGGEEKEFQNTKPKLERLAPLSP